MRADYVRTLLEEITPGQGVVYPTLHGVNVSTVYITQVQKHLAEQPEEQFTVTRGNGDLEVRLIKKDNVCHACGSPHFFVRVINEYSAYIEAHPPVRARPTLLLERAVSVHCQLCATQKDVKTYRFPVMKP